MYRVIHVAKSKKGHVHSTLQIIRRVKNNGTIECNGSGMPVKRRKEEEEEEEEQQQQLILTLQRGGKNKIMTSFTKVLMKVELYVKLR
jgi:hypothetical protein